MKLQGLACLLAAVVVMSAQASERSRSAVRHPGESYRDGKARYLGGPGDFPKGSAGEVAVPLDQLDLGLAASWDSLGTFEAVTHAFEQVRDVRFMTLWEKPKFPRRISWLYPDDGCFARAGAADIKFTELGYPTPTKVFIFGDLTVKTHNSPWGSVSWWYHVAPVVSFHGDVFVLDPAVEPMRPLPLTEWIALAGNPKEVSLSICVPGAYDPGSDCANADPGDNARGLTEERGYLRAEWFRLWWLLRKPAIALGDHPPWQP